VIGMCDQAGSPATVGQALAMLDRALDHLTATDAASLPATVQADTLRALERAESKHTAARARVLAAFAGQAAYQDDGQGSARTWLRWQTRISNGAAAGAVGWARRITAHPVIGERLAAGEMSQSWARQICAWTDKLPWAQRDDADQILAAAARGGVDLDELGGLAREMYERAHQAAPGNGGPTDHGFSERHFRLGITFGGAGRVEGDLTPGCAAALSAVLDSLATKAGPEDTRTADQRRHDALGEACQRLINAGMLPGQAGQARRPAQVYLHMTLSQLRDGPGASQVEEAWAAARAAEFGWLTGPAADATACDARLAPVVTGTVDWAALDRLTDYYLATHGLHPASPPGAAAGHSTPAGQPGAAHSQAASQDRAPGQAGGAPGQGEPPADTGAGPGRTTGHAAAGDATAGHSGTAGQDGTAQHHQPADLLTQRPPGTPATQPADQPGTPPAPSTGPGQAPATARPAAPAQPFTCRCTCGGCTCPARVPLSPATVARVRQTMLRLAADVMSGPTGLAAALRHAEFNGGPAGSRSLPLSIPIPLDTGQATATIPANLVRAVVTRHRHCAFPGCRRPAKACHIHHLTPRSRGGATALGNLVPMCEFHHLVVIHQWGWTLSLNADGTTTATSPHGRTLHDHDPPAHAA
jgi:hypothetical protein